ncbi:MAG TPA: hypothetical protein DDY32_06505, partial [Desulfobulbaceae bacterium]|nr:hypothetical protein [Desulfobulbaceae bacterium]
MVDNDHNPVIGDIQNFLFHSLQMAETNLAWLQAKMHPYFFSCNSEDVEAVSVLASDLHLLDHSRRFILADNDRDLIVAQLGVPGALHEALLSLPDRPISYAQIHTSYGRVPRADFPLEVLEFSFERANGARRAEADGGVPVELARIVREET